MATYVCIKQHYGKNADEVAVGTVIQIDGTPRADLWEKKEEVKVFEVATPVRKKKAE